MPAYIKLGDIKGESRNNDGFDFFEIDTPPVEPVGLLLPAVQAAREAARSHDADTAGDPLPVEEVTLNYMEIEWTY